MLNVLDSMNSMNGFKYTARLNFEETKKLQSSQDPLRYALYALYVLYAVCGVLHAQCTVWLQLEVNKVTSKVKKMYC